MRSTFSNLFYKNQFNLKMIASANSIQNEPSIINYEDYTESADFNFSDQTES
jgi:hypothetical protein